MALNLHDHSKIWVSPNWNEAQSKFSHETVFSLTSLPTTWPWEFNFLPFILSQNILPWTLSANYVSAVKFKTALLPAASCPFMWPLFTQSSSSSSSSGSVLLTRIYLLFLFSSPTSLHTYSVLDWMLMSITPCLYTELNNSFFDCFFRVCFGSWANVSFKSHMVTGTK